MKLESYISMAYTMAYVAAMMNAALWVFKSDRPDKALLIIILLHVCAMLIKTLWRLEKLKETLHESKKRLERR